MHYLLRLSKVLPKIMTKDVGKYLGLGFKYKPKKYIYSCLIHEKSNEAQDNYFKVYLGKYKRKMHVN